eukprot:TRINITY_DN11850_c1_g1_i1.p1 TRINITY_DN11850_c1_g1~~TRINITY_DN11850_c1_g1_i1.p1  ORF type:complete len:167 (+),score=16.16 TRINITY_DN11850_c1_g1_i1:227-727(+)
MRGESCNEGSVVGGQGRRQRVCLGRGSAWYSASHELLWAVCSTHTMMSRYNAFLSPQLHATRGKRSISAWYRRVVYWRSRVLGARRQRLAAVCTRMHEMAGHLDLGIRWVVVEGRKARAALVAMREGGLNVRDTAVEVHIHELDGKGCMALAGVHMIDLHECKSID